MSAQVSCAWEPLGKQLFGPITETPVRFESADEDVVDLGGGDRVGDPGRFGNFSDPPFLGRPCSDRSDGSEQPDQSDRSDQPERIHMPNITRRAFSDRSHYR